MPGPGEPSEFNAAADPVAYERACLAAVRSAVSGVEDEIAYRDVPKRVTGPQLRGEYPDTELVIVVHREEERAELAWHLHGKDFGTPSVPGYQVDPESVADEVLIQVLEFGR
jgi:hypothetical protein